MKPVLMIAGGTIALALFVPQLVPESLKKTPDVNPSNVIRQAPDNNRFARKSRPTKSAPARKRSNRCVDADGVGPADCSASLNQSLATSSSRSKPIKTAAKGRNGAPRTSVGGRSVMIESDANGHFQTVVRMNGRRVPVLVDTGATSVAINISLARKLGISLANEDFVHKAQTANGTVQIAKAKIDNVRVGGIVMDDVEAYVMPDRALSTTLLGMSFLKRLTKYQVENGELRMTQ